MVVFSEEEQGEKPELPDQRPETSARADAHVEHVHDHQGEGEGGELGTPGYRVEHTFPDEKRDPHDLEEENENEERICTQEEGEPRTRRLLEKGAWLLPGHCPGSVA